MLRKREARPGKARAEELLWISIRLSALRK
jgi:hypothetical protein